jgi:Ca2+-binding EF-hand superfamily protein
LQLFASFTDGEGFVSRDAFYQCFQEISEGSNTSESELRPVVEQLYNIFDSDKNGKLDFVELSVGLSVLCAGTRDEKAKSAFSLFDYDGSGSISRQEMERYLTCVFRVVYEIEKQTKDAMGVPPEQLAKITTDQCFDEADLDDDDSLSFEEFKKWYARPSGATTTAKVVRQASDTANNAISLESVKQITGLGSRSVEDVMEMFAEVMSPPPSLSLSLSFSYTLLQLTIHDSLDE